MTDWRIEKDRVNGKFLWRIQSRKNGAVIYESKPFSDEMRMQVNIDAVAKAMSFVSTEEVWADHSEPARMRNRRTIADWGMMGK